MLARRRHRPAVLITSDSVVHSDAGRQLGRTERSGDRLPTLLGPFTSLRGWASVDVTASDTTSLRDHATHLEGFDPRVQLAQASEILTGPANTPLPVVLVCDCNSSASAADPTRRRRTCCSETLLRRRVGKEALRSRRPQLLSGRRPS